MNGLDHYSSWLQTVERKLLEHLKICGVGGQDYCVQFVCACNRVCDMALVCAPYPSVSIIRSVTDFSSRSSFARQVHGTMSDFMLAGMTSFKQLGGIVRPSFSEHRWHLLSVSAHAHEKKGVGRDCVRKLTWDFKLKEMRTGYVLALPEEVPLIERCDLGDPPGT